MLTSAQVICSIHQPSKSVFELFDKLLLLAAGKVIYFGPSRDIITYFTNSAFRFPYVPGTNPADFLSEYSCLSLLGRLNIV